MASPLPPSPLLRIRAWAYGDAACHYLIGIVVELPTGQWVYRKLRVEDRLNLPVPTIKLVNTLRPYLQPPAATNVEEGGPA
jgi:hypothetical protein